MENPKISIIMPFKNTSKYLVECIQSILDQTEKDWELIAVDDHSTDSSFEIMGQFATKDTRIQVYSNSGKGIIAALQLAYSKSKGRLITRMDSDDVMPNQKLEILSTNLQQKGKGHLATGQVQYFPKINMGEGYQSYEDWLNDLTKEGRNFEDLYKECVIPSPCWMVFREDFERCGGFESDIYPEDYDLTFRFYQGGLKVIPSSELLHLWRDHELRTSRNHENYGYESFVELKVYHFLNLHYNPKSELILWGAGKMGKNIGELLIQSKIPFHWICDNPLKIGKKIYKQEMLAWEVIEEIPNTQNIISIASPEAQLKIREVLKSKGLESMKDFFFFC
ncbi:MAG: glycosyltransferase family 2 protein [Crocinitomicaceae bacterium]